MFLHGEEGIFHPRPSAGHRRFADEIKAAYCDGREWLISRHQLEQSVVRVGRVLQTQPDQLAQKERQGSQEECHPHDYLVPASGRRYMSEPVHRDRAHGFQGQPLKCCTLTRCVRHV
jgi:hypothetical protein